MKLRRLRDGDVLNDVDTVLVRGGELESDALREDAVRYHSIYGTYGISVFAIRGLTLDELAQEVPLVRFGRLTLLTVRDILNTGMRLERPAAIRIITPSASMTWTTVCGDWLPAPAKSC